MASGAAVVSCFYVTLTYEAEGATEDEVKDLLEDSPGVRHVSVAPIEPQLAEKMFRARLPEQIRMLIAVGSQQYGKGN